MSGLHGANRLASNSLLEGLVFGRRAGHCAAAACGDPLPRGADPEELAELPAMALHAQDFRNSVQALMWRSAGIVRTAAGLERALKTMQQWLEFADRVQLATVQAREARNLVTVAALVLRGALWREESRGTHFRRDFPERDDQHFQVHSVQQRNKEIHAQPL